MSVWLKRAKFQGRRTYIGTDTPDGDQEEDGTDGKKPVKVVIDSHVGTLDNNVESRLWMQDDRRGRECCWGGNPLYTLEVMSFLH